MMSTATPLTRASAGSGPKASHAATVSSASASTAGTNQRVTRSTTAWIGSFDACAPSTVRTMPASTVSAPTRERRTASAPVPFTVPPTTGAPASLRTGMGSPVSIDSSTWLSPSATSPSAGRRSPGRTSTTSPGRSSATGTSAAAPPGRRTRAVRGCSSTRRRMASEARSLARASSTRPSSTRVTITAAASK